MLFVGAKLFRNCKQ